MNNKYLRNLPSLVAVLLAAIVTTNGADAKRTPAQRDTSGPDKKAAERVKSPRLTLIPVAGSFLPSILFVESYADAPGRPMVRVGGPKPEPIEPPQPLHLQLPKATAPRSVPALVADAAVEAAPRGVVLPSPPWTALGPAPIPNGQTEPASASGLSLTQAPVSGRTIQIVVDPADANIVYVGTAQGGLYRSLDGGTNWTQLFDNALSLAIGSMQLDPTDSNVLIVGTGEANFSGDSYAGVGVYVITDAKGLNPILNGPYHEEAVTGANMTARRGMSGLAVDPNNHDIVYVGTSTGQQGIGPQPPTPGTAPNRGLYRSTNFFGGSPTFTKIPVIAGSFAGATEPNPSDYRIRSIAYEPGSSDRMFVAVPDTNTSTSSPPYFGGVYYTANASAATPTFTRVLATQAGTFSPAEIAVRKVGDTVTVAVVTGEPAPTATLTGRLYTATYSASAPPAAPVFTEKTAARGFAAGQGSYNLGVDIDPANGNNIYFCGTKNYTANDSSGTFKFTRNGGTTIGTSFNTLHVDSHAIAVAPSNPDVIYTGNDGGIWRTSSGTSTVTWTNLNNTQFSATQFQSAALHPIDRFFSIGGTQDNGTEFLRANGTWRRADFGDGGYALIDQTATNTENVTMYHTYYNAKTVLIGFSRVKLASCATEGQWAFRGGAVAAIVPGLTFPLPLLQGTVCDGSINQTLNGLSVADDVNFYAPMALGPVSPGSVGQTVFFGSDKLYRSIDQGDNMVAVSAVLRPGQGAGGANIPISAIAVAADKVTPLSNDNVRVVGTNDGWVFATKTGGALVAITDLMQMPATGSLAPEFNGVPGKYIGRIAIDPNDSDIIYVGYNGNALLGKHLWKGDMSTFPAVTWTAIDGSGATGLPDLSINAIAVDPQNSQHLYVGTDRGVYNSTDGGATWQLYGTGLPNVQVFDLQIHDGFRLLRAATHGRGMYEVPAVIAPVIPLSAVSRKVHGTAGTFDLDLPLTGDAGVESRSGPVAGQHQIIITFDGTIESAGNPMLSTGTGSISGSSIDGDEMTIDLAGVTNAQTIVVTIPEVTVNGLTSSVGVRMGVLQGDANGSARVDSGDLTIVRQNNLKPLTSTSFTSDVNASGRIDSGDVTVVRQKNLTALP